MGCKFLEDRKLMRRKVTKTTLMANKAIGVPLSRAQMMAVSGQPSKEFIQIKYIGLGKSNMAFSMVEYKARWIINHMNTEMLLRKAELLDEYFSIHIDQQQNLTRLPVVLDQHTPDMDHVPEFLLSLGNDVDWNSEKECFQTIAAAIGNFYAVQAPVLPNPSGNGIRFYKKTKGDDGKIPKHESNNPEGIIDDDIDHDLLAEARTAWAQREWTIQHVLFPSMRLFLKPPNTMATNGTFVQVASLEKLYKIFERC
ncbi:hypothetical protein HPP92_004621 [Vanilla planifolia]|uniref:DNA mismatch repair protein Mlh1 C-terminal domain-containing protein n=1 Tax=Vanilla planifolia TaxID=51239 RepID=A0A835RS70_VANPL|nr:hypothetical protein HPP92_004621 [Vanilla planifolia]